MFVSCPTCASTYEVSDDKVRGRTALMRCPSCGASWVVAGPAEAAHSSARSSVAPGPTSTRSVPPPAYVPPAEESRAARRKPDERDQRDMFATPRPSESPPRPSEVPPSASMIPRGLCGERHENSVLFNVADLKQAIARSSEPPKAPSVAPAAMTADDAGEIDLLAMCRNGGTVKPPGAPLFEPDPVRETGFSMSIPPFAPHRQRALFAGAAAAALAFVAFVGVGIGFAMKTGSVEDAKATASLTAPRSNAEPRLTPTTPAVQESASAAASKGSEDAAKPKAEEPTKAKTPQGSSVASSGGSSGGSKTKARATAGKNATIVQSSGVQGSATSKAKSAPDNKVSLPPAPKVKKSGSDPCGCRGNLQCAMKCQG